MSMKENESITPVVSSNSKFYLVSTVKMNVTFAPNEIIAAVVKAAEKFLNS